MRVNKVETWQNGVRVPMYAVYYPHNTYTRFPLCFYNRTQLEGWPVQAVKTRRDTPNQYMMEALDEITRRYVIRDGIPQVNPEARLATNVKEPIVQNYAIRLDLHNILLNCVYARSKVKGVSRLRQIISGGRGGFLSQDGTKLDYIRGSSNIVLLSEEMFNILTEVIAENYGRMCRVFAKINPNAIASDVLGPKFVWDEIDKITPEQGQKIFTSLMRYMSGQDMYASYPPAYMVAAVYAGNDINREDFDPTGQGVVIDGVNAITTGIREFVGDIKNYSVNLEGLQFSFTEPRRPLGNLIETFTTSSKLMRMVAAKAIVR